MTIRRTPAGARLDQHGNRLYTWAGTGQVEEFYSVTTIISGGIPKHGLVAWAAKLVAELAYADVETLGPGALQRWAEEGRVLIDAQREAGAKLKQADETPRGLSLRYLKNEPNRVRDEAGDRGSEIHEAAEDLGLELASDQLVKGAAREAAAAVFEGRPLPEWSDRIRPYMVNGFVPWLRTYRPEFLATEATVYSRRDAYAGTADTFAITREQGGRFTRCIDYTSAKAIRPEKAIQTTAYARAEFVGGADGVTEHPVPVVDGTAVLHLTPTGYTYKKAASDEHLYRVFQYAREIFRFTLERSRSVIGETIMPDLEDMLAASLEQARAAS